MSTTIESLELEINSNSTQAVSGINALSSSLSQLKNAVKGGVGLASVANQVRNLDTALQSVDGSSADKIDKLSMSLSKLSSLGKLKISASIGNQIKNIGSAASSLKASDYENINGLTRALNGLNGLDKASGLRSAITQLNKLPELAKTLNGMDLDSLCNNFSKLSNSLAPLAGRANSVSNAFNKLPASVNKLSTSTQSASGSNNSFASSAMNIYAKFKMAYNAVHAGAQTIASWITKSNEYIEDLNLFSASMGEYAGEAQKYAEQVGELMGIDPGQFMRYEGVFNTIIEGFGVASDRAYTMSKNLTQLGYDLSSFYNISFEDSMQKLQSGISGELEPLRRLGYDLSQARLQQEALNLGIKKSVTDMTQAEKSQLRYYAIMTQVTVAHGDMARTLNAPANQLRILQAQVMQCARALGNIFIPALNAVLPYAIALAKALRLVADQVAKFFGFKLPKVDYSGLATNIGAAGNSAGNLADNASKAGKGIGTAAKKAKELKNNLLGIDELHVMPSNDNPDSGSSGGVGGVGGVGDVGTGGDLGFKLPEYDFLGKLVDSKADEILEKIKKTFADITAIVSVCLLEIGTILVVSGANIPLGIGLMAAGAVGLVTVAALEWGKMPSEIEKVLSTITGIVGGAFLAIGAFLTFTGVAPEIGIPLLAAGAVNVASAIALNWGGMTGDLQSAIATVMTIVSSGMLGLGFLLLWFGVSTPLAIGLIAAGAVGLATSVAINCGKMSSELEKALSTIAGIVGGALLAVGAFLTFTGVAPEIGIPLLAAGAASIVSAIALNWGNMSGDLKSTLTTITTIVGGALLGLGFILLWFGVSTPLAIGLLAAGAASIVTAAAINKGALTNELRKTIGEILTIAGFGSLALGLILAVSGAATALGIGLIVAGAASIATAVALNWNALVAKIKPIISKIMLIAGGAALALGIILTVCGIFIPGIPLIIAGAGSLAAGIALNWGAISKKVKGVLDDVADKFGEFKDAVGKKLKQTGKAISKWAGGVKEYFTKGEDGKNVFDNIKETGSKIGDKLKDGLSGAFKKSKSWVKEHVTDPVSNAIKDSPLPDLVVKVKNTSKTWWSNVKDWWSDVTKNGVSMDAAVNLVKKQWSTVQEWIGKIPVLNQGIQLVKNLWNTVADWVKTHLGGTVKKDINLAKKGWSTVSSWVKTFNGAPVNKKIELIKSAWSTVAGWVKTHLGGTVNKGISLIKNGWNNVASWVKTHLGGGVSKAIDLAKNGWKSVAGWVRDRIGGAVSVTVDLIKGWKGSIKKFLGLESGGIIGANGGVRAFSDGGIITRNAWRSIPKYAGGTSRAHGSMFVAGENGAEMVGHINGQTEVLNRSQINVAMRSAVIAGMSQFVTYWRTLNSTMITCANAVINSVMVSSDVMQAAYATASDSYTKVNSVSEENLRNVSQVNSNDLPTYGKYDKDDMENSMYNAFMRVVRSGEIRDKNINVYLDGDIVYKDVVRRNNQHVYQTGESELKV